MSNTDHTNEVTKDQERLIDAKISLLQLAKELGNIQKACRAAGVARSSFYEIKKVYEQFGRDGLLESRRGKRKQPISEQMEEKVLQATREEPSYSYVRLSEKLHDEGVGAGISIVRRV